MLASRVTVPAALAMRVLLLASCGDDDAEVGSGGEGVSEEPAGESADEPADETGEEDGMAEEPAEGDGLFPDVLDAVVSPDGDGTYRIDATVSSPYDSPARYADAWRVLAPDGTVLGVRELLHDHAGEQPFTRSLSGVEIGTDVTEVTIEGRDQVNGWGGATVTVEVPRA